MVGRVEHRILNNTSNLPARLACKNLLFDSFVDVTPTSQPSDRRLGEIALKRYPFRLHLSNTGLSQSTLETGQCTLWRFMVFANKIAQCAALACCRKCMGKRINRLNGTASDLKEMILHIHCPSPTHSPMEEIPSPLQLMRESRLETHFEAFLQNTTLPLQQRMSIGYCNA